MEPEHKIDIEITAEVVDDGKPEVRNKKESKTPFLTIFILVSFVTFAVAFKAGASGIASVAGLVLFVALCIFFSRLID